MSEMIERVAKAICAQTPNEAPPDEIVHSVIQMRDVAVWELYIERARAAIEAMHQPEREKHYGEYYGQAYRVPQW